MLLVIADTLADRVGQTALYDNASMILLRP